MTWTAGTELERGKNPSIQCFIMLMSNEKFRNAYKQELLDLSKKNFESSKATTVLTQFKNTYEPLFAQYIPVTIGVMIQQTDMQVTTA